MCRVGKLFRVILEYPKRLGNGISLRAVVIDSKIDKTAHIEHHTNIRYSEVGRYSYVSAKSSVIYAKIGGFCSIAASVAIGGGAHNMESISTSPIFYNGRNIFHKNFGYIKFSPFKETVIGNDVWIGNRALILQGVTIGDGAVIGAGSVVAKDVEPYTIVAGNPAKVIRKRFNDETVKQLLEIEWWKWTDSQLRRLGDCFARPEMLIEKLGNLSK